MQEVLVDLATVRMPAPAAAACEGRWVGVDEQGRPLVEYAGAPDGEARPAAFLAHTLNHRRPGDAPLPVWLALRENGTPLIVGLIETRLALADVVIDGERVCLEAVRELELRCGRASLVLDRDGTVSVRGTEIVSRASGSQKIRGASVQIN